MYLWMLAAVVAYFIKGLCGFANTLVFTAILSFGSVNANISPIDLLLGYPANVILTWKNRKNLDPKVYIPLAVLVLAGSIPGAFLLKNVDARAIKLVFGVVVVALGAEMLPESTAKNAYLPPGWCWRSSVWQPGFCAVSLVWALCWPLTSIA